MWTFLDGEFMTLETGEMHFLQRWVDIGIGENRPTRVRAKHGKGTKRTAWKIVNVPRVTRGKGMLYLREILELRTRQKRLIWL